MKMTLVYDWLITMGGGEKTLSAIAEVICAPIYTLIADRKGLKETPFAEKEIHTSFLQHFPFAKRFYRNYLSFFPLAIEQFDLSDYDCILSVSHAVAKGIKKVPGQVHLCYCFTPMRYVWDLRDCYLQSLNGVQRVFAKAALNALQKWDLASLNRVDCFAAISHHVAMRIERVYGKKAEVIYPPVDTECILLEEKKEEYYVTVSRMVPYKKIPLIVEAFSHLPDKRLIVIGDGPEMNRVKAKAGKNIELLGFQSDAQVCRFLQKARGFVFAAEEDFGIVPIEAQAAGTPVIAFGRGGALETVIPDETGVFFEEQTVPSLQQAVQEFEKRAWDPVKVRQNALRFNKARFQRELLDFVKRSL
ncbi:MAG TPA: glycosyltransferase [Rhabdochlamydiaceae bacterium]|jgi:glycosyltransferase involved in cell wall biosynthesis